MEQRISIVTLGVADLRRSSEFYERLGWRRAITKGEGIVFFQAGGMALALYPATSLQRRECCSRRPRLHRNIASLQHP
jgi:catechol 2,3-dioxygenase-like lactoylglutathione lyase family enzyme